MDKRAQRLEESEAEYAVGTPAPPNRPKIRYAVFLTHGMGQPLPFQTIDGLADSLHKLDIELGHENPKPIACTNKAGTEWLSRMELWLNAGDKAVEVHLYEGYWAPLTEGRITARNVMAFLAGGGLNGLRHTMGEFNRWMFEKFPPFPIPVRSVFFLLIGLATVASLVVMNSAIAIIAAARALLGEKPAWLADNLFIDLTTTFNIVVTFMGLFGISLFVSAMMRKRERPRHARVRWSTVTAALFALTLLVVILAGIAIPFFFYGHATGVAGTSPIWYRVPARIDRFNDWFDNIAIWVALFVAVIVGGRWIARVYRALMKELEDQDTARLTRAVALGFLVFALAAVAVVVYFLWLFANNNPDEGGLARQAVAWPLLIAASAYIRLLLVQYVGDVAIYIMPYKLDVFTDLRREIKQKVYGVAKAVYAQKDYAKVVVVGHSLGSVITYDALNMLILEDKAALAAKSEKDFLNVVKRTPLFLTFGCPLDKTAFVFAVQPKGTSEAREALAASVQPMIQDYQYRPQRWKNIWSPWDIISGPLDLYDLPKDLDPFPANPQRVQNLLDTEATTLLMAHTEYWENPLLVGTIYDEIVGVVPKASARRR